MIQRYNKKFMQISFDQTTKDQTYLEIDVSSQSEFTKIFPQSGFPSDDQKQHFSKCYCYEDPISKGREITPKFKTISYANPEQGFKLHLIIKKDSKALLKVQGGSSFFGTHINLGTLKPQPYKTLKEFGTLQELIEEFEKSIYEGSFHFEQNQNRLWLIWQLSKEHQLPYDKREEYPVLLKPYNH